MKIPKAIVLVTVDCLRADHVGFMGYGRPTTPFLDSLAAESFVFPAAIVAGAPTYYSLPGILASRYPLALGRDTLGLAPREPTLASVLKQAGYATAAFSAANPYISSRFGYEQGFDTFQDFLDDEPELLCNEKVNAVGSSGWASRLNRKLQEMRPALGPLRMVYDELYFQYCQRATPLPKSLDALRRFPSADVIVDQACRWMASVEGPFFLWLHLMDPHSPYYPKQQALDLMGCGHVTPFRARYLNSYWNRSDLGAARLARHRDKIIALHDAGIRWVDTQLERLIETIRKSGRWDSCIFAFTADHGEEFHDHGGRYHPPSRLMEELIRVPLLLRVGESAKKGVTQCPFSLLHLAPTLLDAAQVQAHSAFQGISCWPQIREGTSRGAVAISECVAGCNNPFRPENRLRPRLLSVRDARYKLVLHFDPSGEDLFDLKADPGEQAPLAPAAQKPVRRRLLEIAHAHLKRSLSQRDLGARTRVRLRELQLEWARSSRQPSET
jgi:arylsulfatase A-like enzyme